jgi:hypothetical protein
LEKPSFKQLKSNATVHKQITGKVELLVVKFLPFFVDKRGIMELP